MPYINVFEQELRKRALDKPDPFEVGAEKGVQLGIDIVKSNIQAQKDFERMQKQDELARAAEEEKYNRAVALNALDQGVRENQLRVLGPATPGMTPEEGSFERGGLLFKPQTIEEQSKAYESKNALAEKRFQMQATKEGKSRIDSLRREVNTHPDVKNTGVIVSAYKKIESASKKPSAANDMSMVFNFMKLQDPNSTVREGEYANAQNAAGVPDRIRNIYNKVKDGQILNDVQRKDFLGSARSTLDAQLTTLDDALSFYKQVANDEGIDANKVLGVASSYLKLKSPQQAQTPQGQVPTGQVDPTIQAKKQRQLELLQKQGAQVK